jgi:hypothetical protein
MEGSFRVVNLEGKDGGILLKYHPSICMEGLRTITKTLNNRYVARELNSELIKYEGGMLTITPQS